VDAPSVRGRTWYVRYVATVSLVWRG